MQRTAVVTGASSGIGAATAERLAREGYHVVLAARRLGKLEAVAARMAAAGGSAQVSQLDVTDRTQVEALACARTRSDVLIANAGGAIGCDQVADASPDDWLTMSESNVLGTLHMVQALLPKLISSGDGTVLIMGSTAGFAAYEGGGGYVAAKHGTHAIAATLRLELCGQPVRVIGISPRIVRPHDFALTRSRRTPPQA